jgi:hypothetical protein
MAGLLSDGVQELPAGLLAAPAGLGADPAVLVHPGMPLALIAAVPAVATQASGSGPVASAAYSVWRLVTPAVAVQISAQSRHSRMHVTISVTFCSPRSAALSALQAWTQSLSAPMAAASRPASTLNVRGVDVERARVGVQHLPGVAHGFLL